MSDNYDFKLPAGFSMPEGKGVGDTIQIMATLKLEEGGKACLTKLGDTPMSSTKDSKDTDEEQQAPQKSDFINSYLNQMGGAGGGAPGGAPGGGGPMG